MARPLSEEKRDIILASAAEQVACLGIAAPTAKIAKAAGFAEGTLFTYFPTKDDLLNQLFLSLEAELAAALLDRFPAAASPRERAWHLWDRLIDWGAANPAKRKAVRQLKLSDRISEESRRSGATLFEDIRACLQRDLADSEARQFSLDYIGAILDGLAETTLDFIAREPERRADHKRNGFEIFWRGITG